MKEYEQISSFFRLLEVVEGVYAAIARKGVGAMGNAGFIDLGNETIVFDTFFTIPAAVDLRKVAEQYTGHKVTYVINSHYHFDHVLGNQIFHDVPIISTKEARNAMEREMDFSDIDRHRTELEQYIKELEQEIDKQNDPLIIKSLTNQMQDVKMFYQIIPQIHPTLPTVTFENNLELFGLKGNIELHSYGGGHTNSDVFLYLPEKRLAFMGDLVSNHSHPWVGAGDIQKWKSILEKVSQLDIEIIIPGHGMPGTMENVHLTYQYLKDIERIGNELAPYQNEQPLKPIEMPNTYKEWESPHVFQNNIRAFLQSMNL